MIRFIFILSLTYSFICTSDVFADEIDNYYIDSISGYFGVSEFKNDYEPSFLISLNAIELSDNLYSSITFGSIDSESFLSSEIYYSYKLNKIYSLFGGVALFHHKEKLNIGYEYGFKYHYNDKYSLNLANRSFGAFFDNHNYGLMIGIEYRI